MRVRLRLERLQQRLAASALSQNHWAIRIGLSRGHWSDIVNGRHPYPSTKTRQRMLEELGMQLEDLFEIEAAAASPGDIDFRRAIADRYIIDTELGQGGMGSVYLARDVRHGRVVAVKVISPEAVSGIGLNQFLREIATVAQLHHPNILPLYDSGEAAGHPFYVMPWVRGGSLRTRLQRDVRLDVASTIRLTRSIAQALQHAHSERILHCDVKPENILVHGDHPWVMDFGIARKLHSEIAEWPRGKELDMSAGTPAYVSPEQASGDPNLDARSDVYSLACVVYELLAGRTPFGGTTTQQIVSRRFIVPPPPLRDYAPEVPTGVAHTLERALAIPREQRPDSAADFAAELEQAAVDATGFFVAASLTTSRVISHARRRLNRSPAHAFGGIMQSKMLKQSARSLLRAPAFSLSVVRLLGLGVGSVTAIFTVVDHVLLRRLPYPSAERMVGIGEGVHSLPAMRDFNAMKSVEAWAGAATEEANLTGAGDPLRVRQAIVTEGFFPMFGARAAIGRLLQSSDTESAATAVLSYGMWIRVFGSDSTIVGRTIRINDSPVTVVGVVDGTFVLPEALTGTLVDVWRPHDPSEEYATSRDYWMFRVAGRLREGATIDQAQQEAEAIARARASEFPTKYTNSRGIIGLPVRTFRAMTSSRVEQPLKVFLGAVTVLLLVAGANVTHLILARGVARVREMALRRALGARTASLIAQLLVESGLLGLTGALIGVAIAYAGVRVFLTLAPADLPRVAAIGVDARALLFAAGVGLLTAIVFGLIPALAFAKRAAGSVLRGSGRGVTGSRSALRLRNALVVAEVALSLVLIVQAGWLLRSFMRMQDENLGFRTSGIVTMPMSLPMARQADASSGEPNAAQWYQRIETIRESVTRVRGVEGVTFGLTMPLEWIGGAQCCWSTRPDFPGRTSLERASATHPVSEDFFRIFAIPILAGDAWTRSAIAASPAPAVLNEQLATQVFGGAAAAVGATLSLGGQSYTIVGVAANTRHFGADEPYGTAIYIPMNTNVPFVPGNVTMAVRTDRVDDALVADLRAAVWQVEPNVPVPTIRSIAEMARQDTAHRQFDAILVGTFSVIALLLVAGGLAGTLLYTVSQQRRSFGVRLALGATPRGLERSVLRNGVGLAGIGVLIGAFAAWNAGRVIEARLFGVQARDLQTMAIAVTVLLMVAFVSSWIPARRASLTDPMESLRSD